MTFACAPVAGALIDRVGPRPVLIGGPLLMAAGAASYAFVHTLPQALAAATVTATGSAAGWPAGTTFLARLVAEDQRQRVFGIHFLLAEPRDRRRRPGRGAGGERRQPAHLRAALPRRRRHLPRVLAVVVSLRGLGGPVPDEGDGDRSGGYRDMARDRALLGYVAVALLMLTAGTAPSRWASRRSRRPSSGLSPRFVALGYVGNTAVIVLGQLYALRLLQGRSRSRLLAAGRPRVGAVLDGPRARGARRHRAARRRSCSGAGRCSPSARRCGSPSAPRSSTTWPPSTCAAATTPWVAVLERRRRRSGPRIAGLLLGAALPRRGSSSWGGSLLAGLAGLRLRRLLTPRPGRPSAVPVPSRSVRVRPAWKTDAHDETGTTTAGPAGRDRARRLLPRAGGRDRRDRASRASRSASLAGPPRGHVRPRRAAPARHRPGPHRRPGSWWRTPTTTPPTTPRPVPVRDRTSTESVPTAPDRLGRGQPHAGRPGRPPRRHAAADVVLTLGWGAVAPARPRAGDLRRPRLRGRPRLHRHGRPPTTCRCACQRGGDGAEAVQQALEFARALSAATAAAPDRVTPAARPRPVVPPSRSATPARRPAATSASPAGDALGPVDRRRAREVPAAVRAARRRPGLGAAARDPGRGAVLAALVQAGCRPARPSASRRRPRRRSPRSAPGCRRARTGWSATRSRWPGRRLLNALRWDSPADPPDVQPHAHRLRAGRRRRGRRQPRGAARLRGQRADPGRAARGAVPPAGDRRGARSPGRRPPRAPPRPRAGLRLHQRPRQRRPPARLRLRRRGAPSSSTSTCSSGSSPRRCPATRVLLVTADHGMVDVGAERPRSTSTPTRLRAGRRAAGRRAPGPARVRARPARPPTCSPHGGERLGPAPCGAVPRRGRRRGLVRRASRRAVLPPHRRRRGRTARADRGRRQPQRTRGRPGPGGLPRVDDHGRAARPAARRTPVVPSRARHPRVRR